MNTNLATRCPTCSTVFRVVPDQLRVSDGWVRCGRCAEVFNAAQALLDAATGAPRQLQGDADRIASDDPGRMAPTPAQPESPFETTQVLFGDPDSGSAETATSDAAGAAAGAAVGTVDALAVPAVAPSEMPAVAPTADDHGAEFAPDDAADRETDVVLQSRGSEPASPGVDGSRDEAGEPAALAAPAAPAAPDAPDTSDAFDARPALHFGPYEPYAASDGRSDPAFDTHSGAIAPAEPPGIEVEPEPPDATATAPAFADFQATPSFVRRADRAERWRRPRVRLALAGVIGAALLAGAAQVAYVYRDLVAARFAFTAPALQQMCALLGCSIGPARMIDDLTVEASGLLRVAQTDGYRFSVTLRNRSGIALALPSVDLSLSDSQGRLLARRVLRPADMGADQNELGAGRELQLQASLQTATDPVAGYTIELFYP